jgi:hypothetical protein
VASLATFGFYPIVCLILGFLWCGVGVRVLTLANFIDGKPTVSFVNSFRTKKFLAMLSALLVVAGMLLGARVAAADSVWVQSYQRASSAEACVAQPGETPWQAAWGSDSSWSPSWEMWANGGKGGWTCTRSITWARTPAAGGTSARTYALGDVGPGGG